MNWTHLSKKDSWGQKEDRHTENIFFEGSSSKGTPSSNRVSIHTWTPTLRHGEAICANLLDYNSTFSARNSGLPCLQESQVSYEQPLDKNLGPPTLTIRSGIRRLSVHVTPASTPCTLRNWHILLWQSFPICERNLADKPQSLERFLQKGGFLFNPPHSPHYLSTH